VCAVSQMSCLPRSQQILEWRISMLQMPGRTRTQLLQHRVAALSILPSMECWGTQSSGVRLRLCGPCGEKRLQKRALDEHEAEAGAQAICKAVEMPVARHPGPASGLQGVTIPSIITLAAVVVPELQAPRRGALGPGMEGGLSSAQVNPQGLLFPAADFTAGRQCADFGRYSLPPHQPKLLGVRPRGPPTAGPDRSASSRTSSGERSVGDVPPPPCTLLPWEATDERPNASDPTEDTEVGTSETLRSQTERLFLVSVLAVPVIRHGCHGFTKPGFPEWDRQLPSDFGFPSPKRRLRRPFRAAGISQGRAPGFTSSRVGGWWPAPGCSGVRGRGLARSVWRHRAQGARRIASMPNLYL